MYFINSSLFLLLFLFVSSAYGQVKLGANTQISVTVSGDPANGSSAAPAVAPNGKVVMFQSGSSNIVANDDNGETDIFSYNLANGSRKLESITGAGVQGNDYSEAPSVALVGPQGQIVSAFSSMAENLGTVPDGNSTQDIFIRNSLLNKTELISIGTNGQAADGESYDPSIAVLPAQEIVRVAFSSFANNLVNETVNSQLDIFVVELKEPKRATDQILNGYKVKKVSVGLGGVSATGDSSFPKISGDGRFIVFTSTADNLVSNSGNMSESTQVFLYNIQTSSISLISKGSTGIYGDFSSSSPSISFNGRYITYVTGASNIIGPENNLAVVRYDTVTDKTSIVSETADGIVGDGQYGITSMDPSGRYVAFSTNSTNLGFATTYFNNHVYIKDTVSKQLLLVSTGLNGLEANASSESVSVGADGLNSNKLFVAFRSFATNLTTYPTTGEGDVYLNVVTLPTPPLGKRTKLEIPPELKINKKNLTIRMQKFNVKNLKSKRAGTKKTTAEWRVTIDPRLKKDKDKKRLIVSKRNRVTTRKMPPGAYTARYRVVAKKNGKVVASSTLSPKIKFTIR